MLSSLTLYQLFTYSWRGRVLARPLARLQVEQGPGKKGSGNRINFVDINRFASHLPKTRPIFCLLSGGRKGGSVLAGGGVDTPFWRLGWSEERRGRRERRKGEGTGGGKGVCGEDGTRGKKMNE